jgi:hypothetical protein
MNFAGKISRMGIWREAESVEICAREIVHENGDWNEPTGNVTHSQDILKFTFLSR